MRLQKFWIPEAIRATSGESREMLRLLEETRKCRRQSGISGV